MLLKYYHKTSFLYLTEMWVTVKKFYINRPLKYFLRQYQLRQKWRECCIKLSYEENRIPLVQSSAVHISLLLYYFFKKWANYGLFLFIFVFSTCQNFMKAIWCAWDSNPWRQDGSRRRLHSAMTATPSYYFKRLKLVNRCELN